jgi:hypothetical protein
MNAVNWSSNYNEVMQIALDEKIFDEDKHKLGKIIGGRLAGIIDGQSDMES